MKSLASAVRVMVMNVLVFLGAALVINFLAALYLDGRHLWKTVFIPIDEKANVVSLPDRDYAHLIYREKKQLDTQYIPYVAWGRKPFSGKTITINHDGDRTHRETTERPARHIRFFGGSTMWGTGVDDEHTIPAHFNALHPEDRAYNHGQSGFVSRQGLARLINLVNQEMPMDVVIFYDGCNDAHNLCEAVGSINTHREFSTMAAKLELHSDVVDALTGSIRTVIQKVVKKAVELPNQCLQDPVYAKRVATTLVNNWKIARSIASMGGAEFHAILQPVAAIGQPNIVYLPARTRNNAWELVYPLVQGIKAREQLDWVHDFSDAFDIKEAIYIDGCHVNSLGNEIIARRLSDMLTSRP